MPNVLEIDEEGNAEDADVMVCMRLTSPLMLPDNEIDICADCGEAIQHRPHVPRVPRKICFECAEPQIKKLAAKGELHSIITPETAADIAAYIRKKNLS